MPAGAPTLAEQRQALREQLREQRLKVVEQLAPNAGNPGHFPRSVTLRALIQKPELVTSSNFRLALLAGAAALALLSRSVRSSGDGKSFFRSRFPGRAAPSKE